MKSVVKGNRLQSETLTRMRPRGKGRRKYGYLHAALAPLRFEHGAGGYAQLALLQDLVTRQASCLSGFCVVRPKTTLIRWYMP
jgi:hypothetical protein